MKKIVVAVDSFKGCLDSLEVAGAIEAGIKAVHPRCEVVKVPVADGGEGTVQALVWATGGRTHTLTVHGPLMRPVAASYGILGDGRTAVIEMASASGLPLVPPGERNPMETTTLGTGELIADALRRGCRRFILGIGGSATNDAGTGLLQALGFRFLDAAGTELGHGGKILKTIARIDGSGANPLLREAEFRVACDVDNPFSGPRGAAHVYGPQKGADPQMVAVLDRGLAQFAAVIKAHTGRDIDAEPGAGAAGGMGGGLLAFLGARLQPGIALVLETLRFENLLDGASLVITGEGRMDAQTAMGKAPQGVAAAAARRGVPVIALAGGVEDTAAINRIGIAGVFSIMPRPMSLQDAMVPETAAKNIRELVAQLFQTIAAVRP
ncbi:glycerate kinase [Termitidicoccus mucosus]|uniref:glycerate kinase n=1 Tax=Termitidicoccus mucosus TaxID=1184151 RepID=UPI003183DFE6